MRVTVLHVAGCPGAAVLRERLGVVLAGRVDVTVEMQEVADAAEAVRRGMAGSPTILLDGVDPFLQGHHEAGFACRLYRDRLGRTSNAPTEEVLRAAVGVR